MLDEGAGAGRALPGDAVAAAAGAERSGVRLNPRRGALGPGPGSRSRPVVGEPPGRDRARPGAPGDVRPGDRALAEPRGEGVDSPRPWGPGPG